MFVAFILERIKEFSNSQILDNLSKSYGKSPANLNDPLPWETRLGDQEGEWGAEGFAEILARRIQGRRGTDSETFEYNRDTYPASFWHYWR